MSRRRRSRIPVSSSSADELRAVVREELAKAMPALPAGTRVTPASAGYLQALQRRPASRASGSTSLSRDPFNNVTFGPGDPLDPAAIDPLLSSGRPAPRRWDYPTSWNLQTTGNRLVPWSVLRDSADQVSVMRACIETRKANLTGLEWSFGIESSRVRHLAKREGKANFAVAADLQDRYADDLERLTAWWEKPDRINNWSFSEWLGALLEDFLVLDAVSLYPHLAMGGDLHSLELIDSTSIKPLLDYRGATPQAPYCAFQQILSGFPRGEYSQSPPDQVDAEFTSAVYRPASGDEANTDTLIYKVRNRRSNSPYGFCYDSQTEILTDQGWKFFADLNGTELIATRSASGEFEWQKPTAYVNQPYEGDMVRFSSQVYDLLVTPNHRMVVKARPQVNPTEEVIREARWFVDGPVGRARSHLIPGKSHWSGGAEPGQFCLEPADRRRGRHHPAPALKIEQDVWVAFLGLYLAEGCTAAGRNTICISQSERATDYEQIRAMLADTGLNWRYTTASNHCGYFYVNHGPLAEWLRDNCYAAGVRRSWEKRIPSEAKGWTPRLLNLLFDWMMIGDGHTEKNGYRRYLTTSPYLADDLLEVLQKAGREGWIYRIEPNGKTKARRTQYRVSDRPGDYHKVPVPTVERYEGSVHCVSVPNGVVYVRRNGRTAWCGNSCVEQALANIDLWLKRWDWLRSEFSAGVTPEMVVRVDATMTPEQLREYEAVFNDDLSGQTDQRHRARFLPAGFEPSYPQNFDAKFNSDLDLHIIRLICASFGVLPTNIGFTPNHGMGGMGGQGHMQGESDAQLERGTKPTAQWIVDLINQVSRDYLGMPPEVTFSFIGLDDTDEQKDATLLKGYVGAGLQTLNEGRDRLNLPRYGFPEADQPLLVTPTGPAWLNVDVQPTGMPGNLPSAAQNQPRANKPAAAVPADRDEQVPDTPDTEKSAGTAAREQRAFMAFAQKRAASGKWRDFEFAAHPDEIAQAANELGRGGDFEAVQALFELGVAM